jgi:hypothetical protein
MHVYILDTNAQTEQERYDIQKHIDIETCMRRREEFALGASAWEGREKEKMQPQTPDVRRRNSAQVQAARGHRVLVDWYCSFVFLSYYLFHILFKYTLFIHIRNIHIVLHINCFCEIGCT